MPSLKAIRNRIASVKNTRKITSAMKLVAGAKLRRAQEAMSAARPYSKALATVVSELAGVAGKEAHALFEEREVKNVTVIVVTSDRGLAGAFNSNVIKAVERYIAGELAGVSDVSLRIIGKKANQHFVRRNARISSFDSAPTVQTLALALAGETARRVIADFEKKDSPADRVFLAYNEFKSASSQIVRVTQILPVTPPEKTAEVQGDYVYEPSKEQLLEGLLPLYVQNQIYRATLESAAAFFGAQMMAMENATKSAGDMIQKYTLIYNRARQASITKELLEIISGAEALKG